MVPQRATQTRTSETTGHKRERTSFNLRVSTSDSIYRIMQLQQMLGNRTVKSMIQAKLNIGRPGDVYEQEADRVADQVLSMTDPHVGMYTTYSRKYGDVQIQRLCTVCDHEEEEKTLQAKEQSEQIQSTPTLEEALNAIRGSGEPPAPLCSHLF